MGLRRATCYGGSGVESSPTLAFFVDRSAGSWWAKHTCAKCWYAPEAHAPDVAAKPHLNGVTKHEFIEHHGMETDDYYCGCRGWD